MEKQRGDDGVMDSLFDVGIISIFVALTGLLSKLGSDFRKEAQEKRKDMLSFDSVLNEIFSEIRYRETIPAVVEIVEFFKDVQDIRKDIKLEEIIYEPHHLDKITPQIEKLQKEKDEQYGNVIIPILDIIEYFERVRKEKRRLKLTEIALDDSNAEEIGNKLRKLKEGLQEEEKIKRTYRELVDCCNHAGWLLILAALFSFTGIFLVGVAPKYLPFPSLFFWFIQITILGIPICFALKKYLRSEKLEETFFDYKMEYMKPKSYRSKIPEGE